MQIFLPTIPTIQYINPSYISKPLGYKSHQLTWTQVTLTNLSSLHPVWPLLVTTECCVTAATMVVTMAATGSCLISLSL